MSPRTRQEAVIANSFTINLNLTKPEVGADSNLWGGHLNGDMDILDGIFTSASTTFVSIIQKDDSKYVNATTTSKAFILSATLVSTSTTRTLSVPDVSGTIALDMPVGMVVPWAGTATVAPTGWLLCDGSAVSRTTYATLFTAVNTAYGAGNGSTTFNVPDLRGRVVAGLDNLGGSAASRLTAAIAGFVTTTAGAAGGSQSMTAHTHGFTSGGRALSNDNVGLGGIITVDSGSSNGIFNLGTGTLSTGSGSSENVPPTMVMNMIIKT